MSPKNLAAFRLDTELIRRTGAGERKNRRSDSRAGEAIDSGAAERHPHAHSPDHPPAPRAAHRDPLPQPRPRARRDRDRGREPRACDLGAHFAAPRSAPFGAFVRWRPLATLAAPAIPPWHTRVLRIVMQQPRPQPLGSFSGLVPPALRTASGFERDRRRAVVEQLARLQAMLRATDAISARSTTLSPNLLDLLDGAGPHWAGNVNVWIGREPVERHRAPHLRIHAGRANLAAFCVGDRPDHDYAFRVECAAAEWGLALYERGERREHRVQPRTLGRAVRWHAVPGLSYVVLVLRPPRDCARGEALVHVTQRSSEKTAVVEFDLIPRRRVRAATRSDRQCRAPRARNRNVRELQMPYSRAPITYADAGPPDGAPPQPAPLASRDRDLRAPPGAPATPATDCRSARAGARSDGARGVWRIAGRAGAIAGALCATAPARRCERSARTGCSRRTVCPRRTGTPALTTRKCRRVSSSDPRAA